MRYQHPILQRSKPTSRCSIFDLKKQDFILPQESVIPYEPEILGLNEFREKLTKSEEIRQQLGIPQYSYHAYMFPMADYNIDHVRNIIEWCRGNDREIRTWVNEQSGLMLLVIVDQDMSENSGWLLYQYTQQNAKSYQSYGLASWYEFCLFGVPIYNDWQLVKKKNHLIAVKPDGTQVLTLGW